MSGDQAEVQADYKVTVHGGGRLTPARLAGILATLEERGVPSWADLEVNRQPGRGASGWAVIARWDPADEPAATESKGRDVHVHPGGIVINPGAGFTEEDALKTVHRPIPVRPWA